MCLWCATYTCMVRGCFFSFINCIIILIFRNLKAEKVNFYFMYMRHFKIYIVQNLMLIVIILYIVQNFRENYHDYDIKYM